MCLVGRNGSGKSTLLKIAAGTVEADAARASRSPARRSATCRRSRTCRASPPRSPMSRRALRPATTAPRALPAGTAWPHRRRRPRAAFRRRGAPRRTRARAGARARHPAAGRAHQPSRPAGDRMAGARARGLRSALVLISHDRRFRANSRAPPSGSIAASRGASRRASRPSRNGAIRCWRRKSANSTSSAARSSPRSTGCATASPLGASATCAASACCRRCARISASIAARRQGAGSPSTSTELSGKLVVVAEHLEIVRRDADRAGLLHPHPARRPHRHCRPERRRQDHAAEHADRRARAGRRPGDARREPEMGRSTSGATRSTRETSVRDTLTGGRGDSGDRRRPARHVVGYMKDFLFGPGAGRHAGTRAVRRRTRPARLWRARSPSPRT